MNFDRLFRGMTVSGSGMSAERTRMEVIARNIANARATRGPDGVNPYRRQEVLFRTILDKFGEGASGVEVAGVVDDPTPFERIHQPGHPDADVDGYVRMPNIQVPLEMADMLSAIRAYEANLAAIGAMKRMVERTLSMGR